jgi:hypothetical protein
MMHICGRESVTSHARENKAHNSQFRFKAV